MKKLLVILVAVVFLSSCSPTQEQIEKAIGETQTAIASAFTATPENTNTPLPTKTPFVIPSGDFELRWDTYSSEYNSHGGILTIRRQGSVYTQTIVMSDGSSGTFELTVISEDGGEIKLTDRPGNPFGDYMLISITGRLYFIDDQGIIYSVPLED